VAGGERKKGDAPHCLWRKKEKGGEKGGKFLTHRRNRGAGKEKEGKGGRSRDSFSAMEVPHSPRGGKKRGRAGH